MKRKYANRADWKRIIEKQYTQRYVQDSTFNGYITYLRLLQVRSPLFVSVASSDRYCVAAAGYTWVQYFPLHANHALTAMFDDEDRIVQWYFDITRPVELTTEGIPTFEDLYLDVVALPDRKAYLLDEDELLEAHKKGEIITAEYRLIMKEGFDLKKSIENGTNALIERSLKDIAWIRLDGPN